MTANSISIYLDLTYHCERSRFVYVSITGRYCRLFAKFNGACVGGPSGVTYAYLLTK